MATATASPAIDLKSQATYPIRLGTSITKPSAGGQLTSIQYNYKPKLTRSDSVEGLIKKSKQDGDSRLLVKDGEGEYAYSGQHQQSEGSYMLVLRGNAKDKEMTLERLANSHVFNIVRTPFEDDAAYLAQKYPHLALDDTEEDQSGDDDDLAPPDDSNPFDFRHFLKVEPEKREAANANLDAGARITTTTTPTMHPRVAAGGTSAQKPTIKRPEPKAQPLRKRKPVAPAAEKPSAKRVKAGMEPPQPKSTPPAPAKPKQQKPDLPKINMERKASLRKPSADDSGELILENETPISEKPKPLGAMAMALHGTLGSGPISLMSAANSPSSQLASPMPLAEQDAEEEEYVFDFDDDGDDAPEPASQPAGDDDGAAEEADEEQDDGDDDDDDDDVDNFALPAPATQAHKPSLNSVMTAAPGGDEDDDLDQQLARAMMEEESEESEEE